jgi:sulfoxide reductase heme-binding subunit YedZ
MAVAATLNSAVRKVPTWAVYGSGMLPLGWLFWLALNGGLGVEPVETLEHRLGLLGLQFMIATLAVTPLRRATGVNLVKFRRALGLLTFLYIVLHLLVWALLDVQTLGAVWADVVKRPYITVGMAAFALMLPLAATSFDRAVRLMGAAAWRRLHRLTYAAAILGAGHYVMLSKGFQLEPVLYLAAVLGLLAARIRAPRRLESA